MVLIQGSIILVSIVMFLGGVQLLSIGIIGEYLAIIFNEIKERPIYLINEFIDPGANK